MGWRHFRCGAASGAAAAAAEGGPARSIAGGSGRKSLARLATYIADYKCFTIQISRNYRVMEFKEDLKQLYRVTGGEGKPTTFIFDETQLKYEEFLEDVNNILTSGEVPNLFARDELPGVCDEVRRASGASLRADAKLTRRGRGRLRSAISRPRSYGSGARAWSPASGLLGFTSRCARVGGLTARSLLAQVRPAAKAAGVAETQDALYAFFLERVQRNLHVVLCLSPIGEAFRERCRMFPGLVNCTTIDWFTPWPAEALFEVAVRVMEPVNVGDAQIKAAVCKAFMTVHESVDAASARMFAEIKRQTYVTPTSYLEFLRGYRDLLVEQTRSLQSKSQKLRGGLTKLHETAQQVAEMQVSGPAGHA